MGVTFAEMDSTQWLVRWFLIGAAVATLVSLSRRLPAQNVLLAVFLLSLGGFANLGLQVAAATVLGQPLSKDLVAQAFFHDAPWGVAAAWVVGVLNARGVSRLIVRPDYHFQNYGFWQLGLTLVWLLLLRVKVELLGRSIFWGLETNTSLSGVWIVRLLSFAGFVVTALIM